MPLAPLRHCSRTSAGSVERSWRQDPDAMGTGVPESSPPPAFHSPSVSYWQNLKERESRRRGFQSPSPSIPGQGGEEHFGS